MGLPRDLQGRRPVVWEGGPASGRKGPRSLEDGSATYGPSVHVDAFGRDLRVLKDDGTADCDECGMPMFPTSRTSTHIHLDCANHHYGEAPVPRDGAVLRIVENWLSKRGAQLHTQHERWGTDDERGRDKRDI